MSTLVKKFAHDLYAIFYFAAGLFLLLSLWSFNTGDPSLNRLTWSPKVFNLCGIVGSFVADGLLQLFGAPAWLFVAACLMTGFMSLRGKKASFSVLRFIWGFLLFVSVSSLVSLYLPEKKLYQGLILPGGILGYTFSRGLEKVFNLAGAQIVLWSCVGILLVFFSEMPLVQLAGKPLGWGLKLSQALGRSLARIKFMSQESREPKRKKLKEVPVERADTSPFLPLKNAVPQELDEPAPPPTQLEFPVVAAADQELAQMARRRVVMKTRVPSRVENWTLPKLSLLEDPPATRTKVDDREIRNKSKILTDKLAIFNVTGEVIAAKPGPAVTMFEFRPTADVKVSKITELEDDLSLALSSESLRILAPIPGRDVVGIETSNAQRETVYLKDLLADEDFWREDFKLPIALGKQADGTPRIVDLRKMPHLMVAGTTGSGKSVFTVSVITGLIFKHSPKTLRLILIDPKQVDLAAFSKIPHLIMPPVSDSKDAVTALRWTVKEMEKRYKSMQKFGARGIEQFNENVSQLTREQIEQHEKDLAEMESNPALKPSQYYYTQQPYLVVIVEEFADLMSVDKANVETSVVRLAQKARACGIHLMLAMQSPRKEVVTGLIKTNIPGRISFKVNSGMDSRIILDEAGGERLLAQGDMLFKSPGGSAPVRHHGPFLKDSEINGVAKFWSDQAEPEFSLSAMKALEGAAAGGDELGSPEGGGEESEYDEKYDEILAWVASQKEISASLIQRRFQLGYPRAARMVETLERERVVGPANGAKPRQVLIQPFFKEQA